MKRRLSSIAMAAVIGATGLFGAGIASADPTEPPSPPPPAAGEPGPPGPMDMTAMMQACVDQMPPEARDQAWRMHWQMMPAVPGMPDPMMPGGMPGPTQVPE